VRSTRRRCRCSRGTAAQILATAGRYAATPEDAEDARQRLFEILLTKAPSARENKLIHWLNTVVKLLQRVRHRIARGQEAHRNERRGAAEKPRRRRLAGKRGAEPTCVSSERQP